MRTHARVYDVRMRRTRDHAMNERAACAFAPCNRGTVRPTRRVTAHNFSPLVKLCATQWEVERADVSLRTSLPTPRRVRISCAFVSCHNVTLLKACIDSSQRRPRNRALALVARSHGVVAIVASCCVRMGRHTNVTACGASSTRGTPRLPPSLIALMYWWLESTLHTPELVLISKRSERGHSRSCFATRNDKFQNAAQLSFSRRGHIDL